MAKCIECPRNTDCPFTRLPVMTKHDHSQPKGTRAGWVCKWCEFVNSQDRELCSYCGRLRLEKDKVID